MGCTYIPRHALALEHTHTQASTSNQLNNYFLAGVFLVSSFLSQNDDNRHEYRTILSIRFDIELFTN